MTLLEKAEGEYFLIFSCLQTFPSGSQSQPHNPSADQPSSYPNLLELPPGHPTIVLSSSHRPSDRRSHSNQAPSPVEGSHRPSTGAGSQLLIKHHRYLCRHLQPLPHLLDINIERYITHAADTIVTFWLSVGRTHSRVTLIKFRSVDL